MVWDHIPIQCRSRTFPFYIRFSKSSLQDQLKKCQTVKGVIGFKTISVKNIGVQPNKHQSTLDLKQNYDKANSSYYSEPVPNKHWLISKPQFRNDNMNTSVQRGTMLIVWWVNLNSHPGDLSQWDVGDFPPCIKTLWKTQTLGIIYPKQLTDTTHDPSRYHACTCTLNASVPIWANPTSPISVKQTVLLTSPLHLFSREKNKGLNSPFLQLN